MLHMITKKTFKDPCMGDCEVARWFIHVEIKAAPCVSNVPFPCVLPWKKSNPVLRKAKAKAKAKASIQRLGFILKA